MFSSPGMSATEHDLTAFMQQEIAERAALQARPNRGSHPLTGVGKIFKPELKRRETRDALHAALTQGGAPVHQSTSRPTIRAECLSRSS